MAHEYDYIGAGWLWGFYWKEKAEKKSSEQFISAGAAITAGCSLFQTQPHLFSASECGICCFLLFSFSEIIAFPVKPGYINIDLISAAACGYFLLIEVSTFLFELCYYQDQASFKGIDITHNSAIYNDLVYFSSITITSIGFGDITPALYYAKLLTALMEIIGHFYSVVLIGIVISKFVSTGEN